MQPPTPPSYEDVVKMSKSASSLPPAYNVATQTAWTSGGVITDITGQHRDVMDGEMGVNDTRNSCQFLKFLMIVLMLYVLLFVMAWTSLALDGCL